MMTGAGPLLGGLISAKWVCLGRHISSGELGISCVLHAACPCAVFGCAFLASLPFFLSGQFGAICPFFPQL